MDNKFKLELILSFIIICLLVFILYLAAIRKEVQSKQETALITENENLHELFAENTFTIQWDCNNHEYVSENSYSELSSLINKSCTLVGVNR